MSEGTLRMQFDDLPQQREAATLGMWIFLATELLLFSGMLLGYLVYRAHYPETFAAASRHLDLLLASINTAVLLTSSLTIALASIAVKARNRTMLLVLLAATAVLGLVFLGIKAVEYSKEIHENLAPFPGLEFHFDGPNPEKARLFFNLYFVMTGVHALHLLVGIVIIATMAALAAAGRAWGKLEANIEITGLYWHFVDVVWVFLYPILYLIDR